ncbi:hypothetical protein BDP27DRAFT_1370444 [Rhodocollybia butyracea]|uniref:Uncharacterized protein n=1 Tax=Rhodocollybia butyracea TaxID=206335 RepID=A0A9P5PBY2_9AGAR|nr:hypothetical protein BDP27DRAFT_1370444 [Rhodocollybia butyracea]
MPTSGSDRWACWRKGPNVLFKVKRQRWQGNVVVELVLRRPSGKFPWWIRLGKKLGMIFLHPDLLEDGHPRATHGIRASIALERVLSGTTAFVAFQLASVAYLVEFPTFPQLANRSSIPLLEI